MRLSHASEKLLGLYLLYSAASLVRLAQGSAGVLRVFTVLESAPASGLAPALTFFAGVAPLFPILALALLVWAALALRRPADETLVFPVLVGAVVVVKVLTYLVFLTSNYAMNQILLGVG